MRERLWRGAKLGASSLLPDRGFGGILQFHGALHLESSNTPTGKSLFPGTKPVFQPDFAVKTGFQQGKAEDIPACQEQGRESFAYGRVIYYFFSSLLIQLLFQTYGQAQDHSHRPAPTLHVQIFHPGFQGVLENP